MITVKCMRQTITTGGIHYPVFVGFSTAAEILRAARAPSFSNDTPHSDIATNILAPPIRDWQRPLNGDRVHTISMVYSTAGEIMPNPVLLCENVLMNHAPILVQQQTTHGVPTEIWELQIDDNHAENANCYPLWILDGQHRINGMSASSQGDSPLPVVFLLNQGQQVYSGPLVAKLFAQVTTSAQPLDELHNEWLTYAFGLKNYDPVLPTSRANGDAMHAVSDLCKTPQFVLPDGTVLANPFHNRIQFNFFTGGCGPIIGGFRYNCITLKELIRAHYFACSSEYGRHLSSAELAAQMAMAFGSLIRHVMQPEKSVFFGKGNHEHSIMQDAFWVGVLATLLKNGPYGPPQWDALLDALQFQVTAWDFSSWVLNLNGRNGSISRNLALQVFRKAFADGVKPSATGNISDFLKGNDAQVTLEFSTLTAKGRVSPAGKTQLALRSGNRLSHTIAPARHFKVGGRSGNVGQIEIIDAQSPPGKLVHYRERGEILDSAKHTNPLKLVVRMCHYGGVEGEANVDLAW